MLVVPEMRLMFDRRWALTTLDHLVEDFERPSAEPGRGTLLRLFEQRVLRPDHLLAQRVADAISGNHDLHFHTWTYESFGDKRETRALVPYSWHSVWSQPPILGRSRRP